jgi:hypothetical protein
MSTDVDYEERNPKELMPKAKALFIQKLKAFIRQEKGSYILDQLTMTIDTAMP